MKQITKKQGGFTLIEVVLVLAIGALIILMALLAFTGAQRSRRDTARTNLTGTIAASIEQFAANSNGTYPTPAEFTALVASSGWEDPRSGVPASGTAAGANGSIVYVANVNCGTGGATVAAAGGYALLTTQESGQKACKDNTK
jgi:prepilin-type N-terminal cleavage/methylation domain-containing protein